MKSFWNFLKKNKIYGTVNLVGLTVSMAFVLLLAVYVQRQLSTDSFQKNADRIYVCANEMTISSAYWLDKHLKDSFPEIEKSTSVGIISTAWAFHLGNELVYGRTMAADSSFFDIFSYELAAGRRTDWKLSWDRCMVSEKFANAHFNGRDPIGQQLVTEEAGMTPLTICGVFKDFGNSVFVSPDVLVRGEIMPRWNPSHDEGMNNAGAGVCVLMSPPGVDLRDKHDEILQWCETNYWTYQSTFDEVRLIPLRDLYFLKDGFEWTGTVQFGNRGLVNLLLGMCLLLLAFAVLNYVNMTTALMGFRAKEMATRRLVGAEGWSIFLKTIQESTVICAISMVLAILLAEGLAPQASRVLSYPISIFGAVTPVNILLVLVFVLVLGFLSGLVPALLIRRAQPIEIVRGTLRRKTKTFYSKVIIVIQNAVSVVMLVCTLTIGAQIRHMVTADLGYNTKDILYFENDCGEAGNLRPLLDRLRAESCVEAVGLGNGVPLENTNNVTAPLPDGRWVAFQEIVGDAAYFDILGLQVKQDNHSPEAWWLNEFAFKQIGIEESASEYVVYDSSHPIGGIYYDFKIGSLEAQQRAARILNLGEFPEEVAPWHIVVKTTGDKNAARKRVEAIVDEVFPGRTVDAHYLEERIAYGFRAESRVLTIVLIFTILSLLVSALGLFAMSSYHMRQEVRGVAVKKVFGAAYSGVLRDLVLGFMKMVGIASVIGIPVAWFLMDGWLKGYGHRIDFPWWAAVVAVLTVALIAFVSVLHQGIVTARTNPSEALKKE